MVTSFRMISAGTVRKILRSTRSDAVTFVLTALVTVCFDLIEAVEIGIVFAAFFALRTVARRSSVVREELPGPPQPGDDRIALLRLDGAMFFGAAERISKAIADDHDPHGAEVSVVIIRMSQIGMLDATGAHTLAELAEELESRGITVIIRVSSPNTSLCWPTWGSSRPCDTRTTSSTPWTRRSPTRGPTSTRRCTHENSLREICMV